VSWCRQAAGDTAGRTTGCHHRVHRHVQRRHARDSRARDRQSITATTCGTVNARSPQIVDAKQACPASPTSARDRCLGARTALGHRQLSLDEAAVRTGAHNTDVQSQWKRWTDSGIRIARIEIVRSRHRRRSRGLACRSSRSEKRANLQSEATSSGINVPTVRESGDPGGGRRTRFGICAPRATVRPSSRGEAGPRRSPGVQRIRDDPDPMVIAILQTRGGLRPRRR